MKRSLWFAALLSLGACGAPPVGIPVTERLRPAEPPVVETAAPVPEGGPPTLLLHADGPPELSLWSDGTLTAGSYVGRAEIPQSEPYFRRTQGAVMLVTLEHGDPEPAALVVLPTDEPEDPPNRYQLFVSPGRARPRLRRVLDAVIGAYGPTRLRLPGDGSIRYEEDEWSACERRGYPTPPVTRDEVTLRRDGAGVFSVESRAPTQHLVDCGDLAG